MHPLCLQLVPPRSLPVVYIQQAQAAFGCGHKGDEGRLVWSGPLPNSGGGVLTFNLTSNQYAFEVSFLLLPLAIQHICPDGQCKTSLVSHSDNVCQVAGTSA
jgi:hypothetical protein